MTKTLIDIDDELMARAMRATGESTKKATVNRALIELVQRRGLAEYTELLAQGATADLNDSEVVRGAQR